MKIYIVELGKVNYRFKNQLPLHIVHKLLRWAKRVEMVGLLATRKISGFHDEPLYGERNGQRSIRLNRAYRAFYTVNDEEKKVIVTVIEVNKHEY